MNGQIWRNIKESKRGMNCYNRVVNDSDFVIMSVNAFPDRRIKRTRIMYLRSGRLACINSYKIKSPEFELIEHAPSCKKYYNIL